MNRKRVAIIGYSSKLPGTSPTEFWSDLLAGKDLVTEVPADRWAQDTFLHRRNTHPGTSYTFSAGTVGDISGFDAEFFGISPREAAQMDPQQRLLLELAWETLENAGVRPSSIRGSNCGVFIGIASVDYSFRVVEDLASAEAATATGTSNSIAANRISYALDLRGPSMAIDTACSSSLVAFHLACRSILNGESNQALTGGVSLHTHPYGFVTFSKAAMLSPNGRCNVFDAAGDGYVRSEGAGLFLLKDYDHAIEDGDPILAVVSGSAVNSDGRKSGITVPNIDAQIALLEQAYAEAGLTAADVDYIEAHGTGTAVGDPVETQALGLALGQKRSHNQPLLIGSVKSNIGHLEAASGVAGLIKALHCIAHRTVPATIHLKNPNPNILFDDWNLQVPTEPTPLKSSGRIVIGVNSFGFGGANCHVVLESHEEESVGETPMASGQQVPVLISAKSPEALKQVAADLAAYVRQPGRTASLYDIGWTTAFHRDLHAHRALIITDNDEALATSLDAVSLSTDEQSEIDQGVALDQNAAVAFVYSGNGSQWEGMGHALFAMDPTFRDTVETIDAIFTPLAGWSLAEQFAGKYGSGRYSLTEIAQPALFAVQVGITAMLRQRGVNAASVAGHSVGEVAAAWASGALTLEQAIQVIYQRSRCQASTRGEGQMTAVGLDEDSTRKLIAELHLKNDLVIAGINSASAVTVAGPVGGLEKLECELSERTIFRKRLDLDYAFHSPAMDSIADDVLQSLAGLTPGSTSIPFHSSVTGSAVKGEKLDATYWWRNIREPVQFEQSTASLLRQGARIFIEIGPHPVLRSYLQQSLRTSNGPCAVIPTLARNDDGPARVWRAVRQAIIAGAEIDWQTWFPQAGRFAQIPTYPWQRSHHWQQPSPMSINRLQRVKQHPLLGYRIDPSEWIWENEIDTQMYPWLGDHVVGDTTVLPGTFYAEIVLAAATLWQPGAYAEIELIEIRAPLILNTTQSRRIRCNVDPTDGNFSIRSCDPQSNDEWTLHATGRIASGSAGVRLAQTQPAPLINAAESSDVDHNALTRAAGLAYGPAFRAISSTWREGHSVCARFLAPGPILADLPLTHIHPALLDCAFQLIIELLKEGPEVQQGMVYVPVRIEELTWLSGAGQPLTARATLLRRNPNTVSAQFTLFDDEGRPVAAIREARFQKIHTSRSQLERLSHLDYHCIPSPHPLSSARAPQQLFDRLNRQLTRASIGTTSARYTAEVEPLLDVLCGRFAAQALRPWANEDGILTGITLQEHAQAFPAIAPLLQQLIEILREDNALRAEGPDWRFNDNNDLPGPADIWNSLLNDYPDYLPVIQAVGRIGMHLDDLLQGLRTPEQITPRDCNPGTLIHPMLVDCRLPEIREKVLDAVKGTLQQLAPGVRLSVIEFCAGRPLFASSIVTAIDSDRCTYSIGIVADGISETCHHLKEKFPEIELRHINPAAPLDSKPVPANQQFQLVIINPDFETEADAILALNQAKAWLAPLGVLLLLEQNCTRWLDFVRGIQPGWWSGAPDVGWISRYKDAGFWRKQLNRMGLHAGTTLDLSDESGIGPFLICAQAGDAHISYSETIKTRNWLVFADKEIGEYSSRLSRQLRETLNSRGDRTVIITPASQFSRLDAQHYQLNASDPAQIEALLAEVSNRFGNIDGLLHLQGMASTITTAPLLQMEKQLDRCSIASAILKASISMDLRANLWLLTTGVNRSHRSTGSNAVSTTAMDSTLWGFGRTAMNEAAGTQVRLIDIDPATPVDSVSFFLGRELAAPDTEQEIAYTLTGERLAYRLRVQQNNAIICNQTQDCISRLSIDIPGQLRNLQWKIQPPMLPQENEVEVEVRAAGLNFRDVMYALGALTDDAVEGGFAGPGLGLEFSGTVVRTGPGVTDFKPGDRVLGFGANSFSNSLIANVISIAPIPGTMPFASAATIPSAFFTAHYALNSLARIEHGEKILIHGAAGGVGLAAIQIAKICGAEIYATAGSKEKRDFLRMLGVHHVFDSRSLAFADEILAVTDRRGVDVILNSLAGEAINRNLKVLRPFGRFLELGKRDYQENTRIGLRPFRNNISYFAVDADQLMKERPELTAHLFKELMLMFADGTLHPLPYVEFAADDALSAFRHMQQSRHIGKIVINCGGPIRTFDSPTAATGRLELSADATYLISGGLRGFGLKTAEWLAAKGARHLVLFSRSGKITTEAEKMLAKMRRKGVEIRAAACDVTDRSALSKLLTEIGTAMPPLRGVIHAAAIIEDAMIQNLDRSLMQRVWAPKILGALNLNELTEERELDFIVFYSSATTLFGNPGQAAYVAANTWLERYADSLRASGRNSFCVGWGAIADVGFLARNRDVGNALNKRMGGAPLHSSVALEELEHLMLSGQSGQGVMELDWSALSHFLPSAGTPKFSELRSGIDDNSGSEERRIDVHHMLATLSPAEASTTIAGMLKEEIGDILRVLPEKIDDHRLLHDLGFDSLMGVELSTAVEKRFTVRLPLMALNDAPTVAKLTTIILERLNDSDTLLDSHKNAPDMDLIEQGQQIAAQYAEGEYAEAISRTADELQTGELSVTQRIIH